MNFRSKKEIDICGFSRTEKESHILSNNCINYNGLLTEIPFGVCILSKEVLNIYVEIDKWEH